MRARWICVACLLSVSPARAAHAQRAGGPAPLPPGGVRGDRQRIAQLWGLDSLSGELARSASSWQPAPPPTIRRRPLAAALLAPQLEARWSSALPAAGNDGLLWAGRGASALVRGGALVTAGAVRVIVLPELAYSQNRPFGALPSTAPGRSRYASPFHTGAAPGDAPIDLPLRFGDRPRASVGGGQSSITLSGDVVAAGVATENEWWGPGIHTALLLGTAAGGFPHAFLRTARPLRTRVGVVEARLLWGTLTPSAFADSASTTQYRSFSGALATLRPSILPTLTLGVERSVIRNAAGAATAAGRAVDVLRLWESPPTDADEIARATGAPTRRRADQLVGLFARLVAPESGAEAYVEWVRQELPRSLREFLLAPQATQGYTIGAQWISAPAVTPRPSLRIQAEASNVEQSVAIRGLAVRDFYTGFATRDGHTHRGQPLGAATGPGSSSQRLGADLIARGWHGGLFASRVRWENDALYRQANANFFRHDVSLTGGVRGSIRRSRWDLSAEAAYTDRINYLFQNGFNNPGGIRTVDVHDVSISLSVSPR